MKQEAVIQIPARFYVAMYAKFDTLEEVLQGKTAPALSLKEPSKWGEPATTSGQRVCIGEATLTISLYTQDKITADRVAALQEQLRQHRINAERAERAILDQISNLQALTFEG